MHAQYGLAASRIIYGLFVVLTVAVNAPDRQFLWGTGSAWAQPYRAHSIWGSPVFGYFNGADPSGVFTAKYLVLGILGVCMMMGLASRVSTIAVFFMFTSLIAAGPTSTDTEDVVARIVLLWLCFADTSQRLSLDRWIARRRGLLAAGNDMRALRPGLLPDSVRVPIHNAALVLIGAQIIIIYLVAGLAKLRGSLWRDGTAIYYPLHAGYLSPWPSLSHFVANQPLAVHAMSWGSVVLQIVFGLLLLRHRTRVVAVVAMVSLHAGIALFLGLGLFSLAMVGADFAFIQDRTVARLASRLYPRAHLVEHS
ncbi:HTTM domain-containing protein [Leekyejoonella antrihumi]|nr:HTTM domain-containing protein [Leekyejoonella antrihumi]